MKPNSDDAEPSDEGLIDRRVNELRKRLELTHGMEIGRRYFAMNAFDGVFPVLGILMGGLISMAHQNPVFAYETSFVAILGTSFAMFVSGITSSYLTEGAERERDIKELEKALLTDLEGSTIDEAAKTTTIILSLLNGISPALAALITVIPLFLPILGLLDIILSFVLSIAMGMVILFALGLFLGRVSKTNMMVYGLKTLAAGFFVVVTLWVISLFTG